MPFGKSLVPSAILLLACDPAQAASQESFEASIANYNQQSGGPTQQHIAAQAQDASAQWDVSTGAIPFWLGELGLSAPEYASVISAIGAYGLDQDLYSSKRKSRKFGIGHYVGNVALAIIEGSALARSRLYRPSNTQNGVKPSEPSYTSAASGFFQSREARFFGAMVNLNSCAGAFLSARQKLIDQRPKSALTRFVDGVYRQTMPLPVKPDANCSAGTDDIRE